MKKLILIVLVIISFGATAQTLINKKDDFTGKQIKAAVVVFGKALAPQPISLSFNVANGKKYIAFTWANTSGMFNAFNNVKANQVSLLFKLDTANVTKFNADPSMSNVESAGATGNFTIAANITDEQLLEFVKHKVLKFRLGLNGDDGIDLDGNYMFTDRNKNQLQKAAAFMLDMQVMADDKN